ncbi:MAG: DUF305 domain-containing protein [Gemmatimonadetes bacterium]|nr:DUF305 domain-containing protein [Gemmatimonadota bacterium]
MKTLHRRSFSLLAAAATVTACAGTTPNPSTGSETPTPVSGARIVQPGAPGQASRTIEASELERAAGVSYSDADVYFMQGMISHHAQALDMTALARRSATTEAVRLMSLRMEISQRDEIGLMERWLTDHGESTRMDMGTGMQLMPGMLSPEQMQKLGSTNGGDFDRLFLELMIQHHQGAVVMVGELFNTSGAGQESLIFKFASDVHADQTMEIERMQRVLNQTR